MKRLIIISTILFFCFNADGQVRDTIYLQNDTVVLSRDTTLRNQLVGVNFKKFIGKTVGEMLQDSIIKQYKSYFSTTEPPGVLYGFYLVYARGLYVFIYVNPLKHQPLESLQLEWNFELFKREKINNVALDRNYFEKYVVNQYSGH